MPHKKTVFKRHPLYEGNERYDKMKKEKRTLLDQDTIIQNTLIGMLGEFVGNRENLMTPSHTNDNMKHKHTDEINNDLPTDYVSDLTINSARLHKHKPSFQDYMLDKEESLIDHEDNDSIYMLHHSVANNKPTINMYNNSYFTNVRKNTRKHDGQQYQNPTNTYLEPIRREQQQQHTDMSHDHHYITPNTIKKRQPLSARSSSITKHTTQRSQVKRQFKLNMNTTTPAVLLHVLPPTVIHNSGKLNHHRCAIPEDVPLLPSHAETLVRFPRPNLPTIPLSPVMRLSELWVNSEHSKNIPDSNMWNIPVSENAYYLQQESNDSKGKNYNKPVILHWKHGKPIVDSGITPVYRNNFTYSKNDAKSMLKNNKQRHPPAVHMVNLVKEGLTSTSRSTKENQSKRIHKPLTSRQSRSYVRTWRQKK